MERQKFEDSFSEAFKEAEVMPSDSVWTNVELDLEKASGGEMKRRLLFFQLLAAASMVFAMGVGAVYYLNTYSVDNQMLVQQLPTNSQQNSTSEVSSLSGGKSDLENVGVTEHDSNGPTRTIPLYSQGNVSSQKYSRRSLRSAVDRDVHSVHTASVNSRSGKLVYGSRTLSDESMPEPQSAFALRQNKPVGKDRELTSKLVDVKEPEIVVPVSEPDPGMLLLARLQDEERKYVVEKPVIKEKTWASFGIGAGSFNPQASASVPPAQKTFGVASAGGGTKMSSSNPTSGSSYSVGVSMAGKISRRVVLQGGLSYLTQNAEFTSSSAVGQNASLNEIAVNSDEFVPTSPYKVNNNLQYLSVPVQAGYVLLDRGFGILVNGGVSTDLFLQNTLTPSDKSLGKVTQGSGSDSPYRTVNFSGLVGTEFSYKVADQYRIAVSPGLRYALNSVYKSEVDSEMSPMTFDVSVRFRYIFK